MANLRWRYDNLTKDKCNNREIVQFYKPKTEKLLNCKIEYSYNLEDKITDVVYTSVLHVHYVANDVFGSRI